MSIRNNIARIGATALISCGLVATTVPATFADEAAQEISFTYADSARLITPDTWIEGQGLIIAGEGFKTADGASGSVLALKLNKGAVKINGQDYLEIHADEAGNFTVTVPWQSELQGNVSVDLYLLSGSLKDGDVPRGGKAATVTIKAANESLPTPAPSESTEPTPAPSEDPTPAPSEDPTPAPTTEAPKPAEETSAPAVEDAKETKPAEDQKSDEQKSEDQKSDEQKSDEQKSDEQKSEDQAAPEGDHAEGDSAAPKSSKDSDNLVMGSSDNDNMGSGSGDNMGSGSSNASSKSSSSLAKTGASGAMTAAGLGLIALGAGGATIVATRMRKKA
ncbi:calcium-binding protein [uncultured Rothia sp.]|uniref:calcium-binding protein n=1 Tax=uncultured Rothia sp. TaxID=316088 RepID=UPI0028E384FC|nr:calcium-binding protein [uncultured Rothia sp.]